jgi:hypothetical protein
LSSSDEEPKPRGDYCYGTGDFVRHVTFTMADGDSHWWNYVAYFDKDGVQTEVYIENEGGEELQDGTLWTRDCYYLLLSVGAPQGDDDDSQDDDGWGELGIDDDGVIRVSFYCL